MIILPRDNNVGELFYWNSYIVMVLYKFFDDTLWQIEYYRYYRIKDKFLGSYSCEGFKNFFIKINKNEEKTQDR